MRRAKRQNIQSPALHLNLPGPLNQFSTMLFVMFFSNSYGDAVPASLAGVVWRSFWFLFQDISSLFAFNLTWDLELDLKSDVWRCAELRDFFHKPTVAFSLELSSFRACVFPDPMFSTEGSLWTCYSLYSSYVSPNSLKLPCWRWVMLHQTRAILFQTGTVSRISARSAVLVVPFRKLLLLQTP